MGPDRGATSGGCTMGADGPSFLQLDTERMREIGHLTIDALVDEMARSGSQPVVREGSVGELRQRLQAPPPSLAWRTRNSSTASSPT